MVSTYSWHINAIATIIIICNHYFYFMLKVIFNFGNFIDEKNTKDCQINFKGY